MARTSTLVWLVTGALIVAACGGGDDDASPDPGTPAPDAATSTEGDGGDDGAAAGDDSVAVDEPVDSGSDEGTDTDTGDDGTGSSAGFGPMLEPVATFATPIPSSAVGRVGAGIAVSPTGDRVAAMWVDESDLATNLAVYDAATGTELVSIVDDRLDGDLFWTSDDRIITAGNFGVLWAWDSVTLEPVSEEPLSEGAPGCAGGNGTVFDPVAGALYLKSDSVCRIDVTTGEATQYESENRTTLLAVAIGGNEVYLRGTDDAGDLVLRVLDATSLAVISDEPSDGPNPIIAASGNGRIEQESGGFGYLVQPSGRVVDFNTSGIETSGGGGYYVSGVDGGAVVINSSDGSTVGTIESSDGSVARTAWSADDNVLAALTADGVSVYRLG
jgi:hypothetical protein